MTSSKIDRTRPDPPRRGARPYDIGILALCFGFFSVAPPALAEPDWSDLEVLLAKRCVMCHSGTHAARGLQLDSYEGIMAGSENGSVLVPGDTSGSELVRRLRGESKPRMPFLSYPLSADEISLFERWIAAGSPREDLERGR